MNNIEKVKREYYVNEAKRTVVCVMTTVNDYADRLKKYGLIDEYDSEVNETKVYRGIAKCSPEDKWDVTYGKRLAEYRAAQKRQKDINDRIANLITYATNDFANLWRYGRLKEPHFPLEPNYKE